jgi:PIN domain nuclease of toxin-antitoxin system
VGRGAEGHRDLIASSVLLDTHVLAWWLADGKRLSRLAAGAIEAADDVLVSALSCWEVATLHRLGRLRLDRDPRLWVRDLFRTERVRQAELSPEAAAWAGSIDGSFRGDPIDRLLYATARDLRVPLVSKDEQIRAYAVGSGDVSIIW